jgi:hypothetical protein
LLALSPEASSSDPIACSACLLLSLKFPMELPDRNIVVFAVVVVAFEEILGLPKG